MTDRPLTKDEQMVLRALMDRDTRPADNTDAALAERTGRGARLSRILTELERGDPPYVEQAVEEGLGQRAWAATLAGSEALEQAKGRTGWPATGRPDWPYLG